MNNQECEMVYIEIDAKNFKVNAIRWRIYNRPGMWWIGAFIVVYYDGDKTLVVNFHQPSPK